MSTEWKNLVVPILLTALLTALLTGVAAWLLLAKDLATRADLDKVIQEAMLYKEDRAAIRYILDENKEAVKGLAAELKEVSLQQAKIATKIDSLLRTSRSGNPQ